MKRITIEGLDVIKPQLTIQAMCIYKYTLSNNFYYFGGTSNLCERISTHLKEYRNNKLPERIQLSIKASSFIKFEIIRFVNDRKLIKKWEDYYLKNHVGLPFCLNTVGYSTTAYKKGQAVFKVAQMTLKGDIVTIHDSPFSAAIACGVSPKTIQVSMVSKYPRKEPYFRKVGADGNIINPAKPLTANPSKKIKVNQYDKKMNFIQTYDSLSDAARAIGSNHKDVSKHIRGRGKTIKGFIFRKQVA